MDLELPHREVAAALGAVRASRQKPNIKLAFGFLVLTAARSGEVRLATWDEIDATDHVWSIPAARMKMKRDHRAPLCGRAMEVLDSGFSSAPAGVPPSHPPGWSLPIDGIPPGRDATACAGACRRLAGTRVSHERVST